MGAGNAKPLMIPEPLLAAVAAHVAGAIGLHFPPDRAADLTRAVQSIAADLGFETPQACAEWLARTPADRPHAEMLARHLTVGETYFFREPAIFNALRDDILPGLLRDRRAAHRRQLRIWSAGCASGEEAYSLAILLEMAVPDLADWDVRICASDINPVALRLAAQGLYRAWSFRNVPANLKTGYFRPRQDGWFELNERIRRRVTFSVSNLVGDAGPLLAEPADIILCRNVLMYFAPQTAAAVAGRLAGLLAPDGWLVTGAAETAGFAPERLGLVKHDSLPIYGKRPMARAVSRDVPDVTPIAPVPRAREAAAEAPQTQEATAGNLLDAARAQADGGKLKEALALVGQAISADKTDAAAHFLQASILLELDARAEATSAYDRVLYLAPDFVMAQYMRGIVALQDGQRRRALQSMEATLGLLARHRATAVVAEADGLTAAQLADLAEATIALIGSAA